MRNFYFFISLIIVLLLFSCIPPENIRVRRLEFRGDRRNDLIKTAEMYDGPPPNFEVWCYERGEFTFENSTYDSGMEYYFRPMPGHTAGDIRRHKAAGRREVQDNRQGQRARYSQGAGAQDIRLPAVRQQVPQAPSNARTAGIGNFLRGPLLAAHDWLPDHDKDEHRRREDPYLPAQD